MIVVAGTVLFHHFTRTVEQVPTTRFQAASIEPPKPILTGALTLESSPSGAAIYLDGAPMKLPDDTPALTPSDLKCLQYGRTYVVTLRMEGYRTSTFDVTMGDEEDGKSHHPTLQPFPGRLVTEVRGLRAEEVRIRYDGVDVGFGPRVQHEVQGNTTVLVEATLEGRVCRANPARVRVLPNRTQTTEVTCAKPRPPPPRRAAQSSPAPRRAAAQRRARALPKKGCVTDPNLPSGWVTIATRPYSTIFWKDRELGQTPISKKPLPAGCVELRAVTADGKTRRFNVEVEPNLVRVYRLEI